ncbi:hypothetical protein ACFLSQ_08190 [Bacteroidota bacterium]
MKKSNFIVLFITILSLFILSSALTAQTRYAVLPFQNMEGKINLNIWCYRLQDSVQKAVVALDPEQKHIQMVPVDEVEDLLAELNLDPTNPQYPTDMWKAVQTLNVEKVITGNFYIRANKLLINAYVYDVRTKMADPRHQAKNIFKKEEDGLTAVNIIVKKLKPLLIP